MVTEKTKIAILVLLLILSVLALAICPLIGMSDISVRSLLQRQAGTLDFYIYRNIRLPRVLLAFMVGAMLSLCGMVFQAIFRNPLTTPFTLGVSSGAAFGAIAFIVFGAEAAAWGLARTYSSAFAGALLAVLVVYLFTRLKGGFSTFTMLLAGVAMNFFFSSLILLFQYLADSREIFQTYRWLMGSLETFGFGKVIAAAPFFFLGTVVTMMFKNELNLMLLGEDMAASRGLDADKFKMLMFGVCSLMVGASVSLCGVIGFVGMISPHICRLLIGADHKYLAKASFLFGGLFMVACDTVARKLISPSEMPIGVITALLGGPFFLWLLAQRGRFTSS